MQIVYISNRPTIFAETLAHVAVFMPFIERALVCVPDNLIEEFESVEHAIPTQVMPESDVLDGATIKTLPTLDHQKRNYSLRTQLITNASIDEQFIMSDDDARPLKQIDLSYFIEDKKFHRYYFYDLADWNNNQTDFDRGQINTYAVLEHNNLPYLSYASHMPQIIDRELYLESITYFKEYTNNFALCEWSSYFNYAGKTHPQRFNDPQAFATLCWPEHPLAWEHSIKPSSFLFENYTPSLYQAKQAFSGLSNDNLSMDNLDQYASQLLNIQKVVEWRKHYIIQHHPEQAKSMLKYLNIRTWLNKLNRRK